MKDYKYKDYLYMGIVAVLVIVACITVAFIFLKWDEVQGGIRMVNDILAPITYGAILAYLMTPVYNRVSKRSRKLLMRWNWRETRVEGGSRLLATAASLVLFFAVVSGLFLMLIPQVVTSIEGIVNSLPNNAERLSLWIQTVLANNPDLEQTVLAIYNDGITQIIEWSTKMLNVEDIEKVIKSLFTGVMGVVSVVMNIFIGIIVMVYLLNIKDRICAQAKKSIYSLFSLRLANEFVAKARFVHHVFGGFIIGKILDSLIIGIISFICLSFMKMPYVLLISVIIGVTNVIPFFGPFIGAIPSALLILLVNPIQCLYFLIFILILQQIDGNIIGPKILGDSTGLSSFWVLFSILLFGGLFGFVGMIIGVPTFAVIYQLISERVTARLKKKDLNMATTAYYHLKHIDQESGTYIWADTAETLAEKPEEDDGQDIM